jgi:hypothetical protein
MVDGNYGVYNGKVYSIGFDKNKIMLFPDPGSENDIMFNKEYLGTRYKSVNYRDLSEAYKLTSYAEYKGYKIPIGREVGDEYELYLTDHELAQKLGFKNCDKGEYDLMVKKSDVNVVTEKTPIDLNR